MNPLITVVTATRTGTHLMDCIHSVRAQTYPFVEHLIIIDKNYDLIHYEDRWKQINSGIRVVVLDDVPEDMFVNARIGALYNRGFDMGLGEYLARVDDDNTIESNHLEALYETIRLGGYDAAYSWRHMWTRDGQPYHEPLLPWHSFLNPDRGRYLYRIWEEAGIVTPGSHIYKDQLQASYQGFPFSTVDASEWLYSRELLKKVRFTEKVNYWQILYDWSDDDMLSLDFIKSGFRAGCSELPTLNYFLGGHSNSNIVEENGIAFF
ncbi:glycosyltransferase [Paenibacillus sp. Y412MC10]|uniref:glycosyltransferase family 2 protein n=1 Tax=Geobacillus sp. (strain Y412MC10) TaxID=481743 RepID=UPI0016426F89|nr:glycosyltransferase [Paenibacillus sp. Y412MC10]